MVVNGRVHSGDIYSYGFGGLPCLLEAGDNDVFVNGIRSGFKLTFEEVVLSVRGTHSLEDMLTDAEIQPARLPPSPM